MESLTCVKGSAARFVIDRGIDRLRPSGNRTMTNFGPRADLSPTIGSTWPKSPWRREIIRTSDTSPSTMGVFCVDRGSHARRRHPRPRRSQRLPNRACRREPAQATFQSLKTMRPRAGWPDPRRSKAVDNGGLRYGAVEGALRPPLPTATQSALHDPTILLGARRPKIGARLTDRSRRYIIAPIRGSERWVAGIKSESRPASDRNRWPASY